ncbi:MAG TPA: hypothetical protein VFH51_14620 [Myxococcota bacterium]|nr:hypothetical protein [Myxococcota bacterium]
MCRPQPTTLAALREAAQAPEGAPSRPAGAPRPPSAHADEIRRVEGQQRTAAQYFVPRASHAPLGLRNVAAGWRPRFAFNGNALVADVAQSDGQKARSVGVTALDRSLNSTVSHTTATHRGQATGQCTVSVGSPEQRLRAQTSYFHARTGTGWRAAVTVAVRAREEHRYDGAASPSQASACLTPAALCPGLPPGAEVHAHERTRERGFGLTAVAGLSAFGRVQAVLRHDRLPTQHVTYDMLDERSVVARLLRRHGSAFGGWLTHTWRALCGIEQVATPAVERPERLRVGEVLRKEYRQRSVWLTAVGAVFLFLGWHRSRADTASLRLHRTSQRKVEVEVEVGRLGSRRGFAVLAGAGYDGGGHRPVSQAWRFELDLGDPAGLRAYAALLAIVRSGKGYEAQVQAIAAWREDFCSKGARAMRFLERRVCRGEDAGHELGSRFRPFPMSYWQRQVPGFGFGLCRAQRALAFEETVEDRGGHITTRSMRGNEREWLLGPWGVRLHGTSSSLEVRRARGGDRGRSEISLQVISTFKLSRATSGRFAAEVRTLAERFACPLPHGPQQASVQREVTLSRRLSEADLGALGARPAASQALAAQRAGLPEAQVAALCAEVAAVGGLRGKARRVQAFVSRHGLSGMAAIHALLGRDEALVVTSNSQAYKDPLQRRDRLTLEYGARPLGAGDDRRALVARFAAAQAAMRSVQNARDALAADPFVSPNGRTTLRDALTACEADVRSLVTIPDAETARVLRRELKGCLWWSAQERHIDQYLRVAEANGRGEPLPVLARAAALLQSPGVPDAAVYRARVVADLDRQIANSEANVLLGEGTAARHLLAEMKAARQQVATIARFPALGRATEKPGAVLEVLERKRLRHKVWLSRADRGRLLELSRDKHARRCRDLQAAVAAAPAIAPGKRLRQRFETATRQIRSQGSCPTLASDTAREAQRFEALLCTREAAAEAARRDDGRALLRADFWRRHSAPGSRPGDGAEARQAWRDAVAQLHHLMLQRDLQPERDPLLPAWQTA